MVRCETFITRDACGIPRYKSGSIDAQVEQNVIVILLELTASVIGSSRLLGSTGRVTVFLLKRTAFLIGSWGTKPRENVVTASFLVRVGGRSTVFHFLS